MRTGPLRHFLQELVLRKALGCYYKHVDARDPGISLYGPKQKKSGRTSAMSWTRMTI
jgi:hypothetical protein